MKINDSSPHSLPRLQPSWSGATAPIAQSPPGRKATIAELLAGSISVQPESAGYDLANLFDHAQSGLTPIDPSTQSADSATIETTVEEESGIQRRTKITKYPDGTTEKEVLSTKKLPNGTETIEEQWDRKGHYVKITNSDVGGHFRTEVTHCNPDGSLRSTFTSDRLPPPNNATHEYTKEVEAGKTTEKIKKLEVDKDQNSIVTEETRVNGNFVRRVRTTTYHSPDLDLPGQGWIGSHNPQDLLKHLGDESQVRAVKVEEESIASDGSLQTHTSIRLTSGDKRTELIEHKTGGQDSPSTWELRKMNSDGTWNSQLFFQGTEDTVVTRSHKEGEWEVQTQDARTEQIARDSGGKVPSAMHSETFTNTSASAQEIAERLSQSKMAEVCKSYCYVEFMKDAPGPYEAFLSMETSTVDGKATTSGSMVLKGTDGTMLFATFDEARKLISSSLHPRGATEPSQVSFLCEGEQLEIGPDGQAVEVVEGVRRVLDRTGSIAAVGKTVLDDFKNKGSASAAVGSKWANRIGIGASSGVMVLAALQLATAIAEGDTRTAALKAGELGLNLAIVIKSLNAEGWDDAAKAGSKGNWLARGGRLLGAAGIILNMANVGQDLVEGNLPRAAVGAAGVAGSALTLMASGSWAGPIGWGLIGLSIMGGMALDYNDRTRVAKSEI